MIIYTDNLMQAALAASYWRVRGCKTTIIAGEGYEVVVSDMGLELLRSNNNL